MEEKKFDVSQLYIVDFIKYLGHKKNIFAVIYLVINVLIISAIIGMFGVNPWLALLFGILAYALTATIALSPVGEWLFRKLNGCKSIDDPAILNRLKPLFEEVKSRAKSELSGVIIHDDISLYICDDDAINAFAMGRRTVCVTRGLLSLTDDQIKGVLGHEFGHLATHDTDLSLLITVGNLIINAVVSFIRLCLVVYNAIVGLIAVFCGDWEDLIRVFYAFATFIVTVFINGLMWVWTKLGILLVMKSSRDAEFEADAFSCDLGYSEGLLSFFRILENMEGGPNKTKGSIFAALAASHPDTTKRIERIETRALPAVKE